MTTHEFLLERGYNGPIKDEFKDLCVYYHKRIPGVDHQQWVVREYDFSSLRSGWPKSYEVSMCYECKDGTWVDTKFYSLTADELMFKLPNLEERLHSSVEPMGGDKNHYQGHKDLY